MNKELLAKKAQVKETAQLSTIEQVYEPIKCQNETYDCTLMSEEGQKYCIKHILQDTTAPYKQCSYIYLNGKQCTQARRSEERNDSK